jgi:hypothetical protein
MAPMRKPYGMNINKFKMKRMRSGANQKRNGNAPRATKSMRTPPYSKM